MRSKMIDKRDILQDETDTSGNATYTANVISKRLIPLKMKLLALASLCSSDSTRLWAHCPRKVIPDAIHPGKCVPSAVKISNVPKIHRRK